MEFSCLHFFFSLPNAVECGTSLGCSEQQHFHGEATRARMPSASQGSNSRGHLDRPTFGRYWVWQCSSLRDCFALPHHSRISSSRLGLPWLDLFMEDTDRYRTETAGRLLYLVPGEQHSLPGAWQEVTGVGWQAGKTFLYPEAPGNASASQKRLINMARGCLAARLLRNCLKCCFLPCLYSPHSKVTQTLGQ